MSFYHATCPECGTTAFHHAKPGGSKRWGGILRSCTVCLHEWRDWHEFDQYAADILHTPRVMARLNRRDTDE